MLIASEQAAARRDLTPRARIVAVAAAGAEPLFIGIGPVPAVKKLAARTGFGTDRIDVIELNKAFAVQAIALLREELNGLSVRIGLHRPGSGITTIQVHAISQNAMRANVRPRAAIWSALSIGARPRDWIRKRLQPTQTELRCHPIRDAASVGVRRVVRDVVSVFYQLKLNGRRLIRNARRVLPSNEPVHFPHHEVERAFDLPGDAPRACVFASSNVVQWLRTRNTSRVRPGSPSQLSPTS